MTVTVLSILVWIFVFSTLSMFFKNWEDERPDLGGFGGRRKDE